MGIVLVVLVVSLLSTGCKTQKSAASKLSVEEREALKKEIMAELLAQQAAEKEKKEPEKSAEERVQYTLDMGKTGFKYAGASMGRLYYTPTGNMPANGQKDSFFYVFSARMADKNDLAPDKRKQLFIDQCQTFMPGIQVDESSIQPVSNLSFTGYEGIALRKDKEDKTIELIYLRIVADDIGYYAFYGRATEDFETRHRQFIQLAETLKLKEEVK